MYKKYELDINEESLIEGKPVVDLQTLLTEVLSGLLGS